MHAHRCLKCAEEFFSYMRLYPDQSTLAKILLFVHVYEAFCELTFHPKRRKA